MLPILFCGTIGCMAIGAPLVGWIDGICSACVTLARIGFGATVDLSRHAQGRVFTVFIAVVGIGTMG